MKDFAVDPHFLKTLLRMDNEMHCFRKNFFAVVFFPVENYQTEIPLNIFLYSLISYSSLSDNAGDFKGFMLQNIIGKTIVKYIK